jgi:hypothetical protein
MAVINQSPSGQTSIAISGISFTSLVVGSGDPFREPVVRLNDGGASVAISFGGGAPEPPGPTIPTTGQIWPLGIPITNA